jgi:hypothetical protein
MPNANNDAPSSPNVAGSGTAVEENVAEYVWSIIPPQPVVCPTEQGEN